MKVDFIVLGAMKCGTSSLSDLLGGHPSVSFSVPKEPDFFSKYDPEAGAIENYHKRFSGKSPEMTYGEGSTSYTKFPHSGFGIPEKIYRYNPDMKFIYMLRHPIERILSHYMHNYQRAYVREPLDKSVLKYAEYVNVSKYHMQIKPYLDLFGKDKVLLVEFEDFISGQREILLKVADFVGLSAEPFESIETAHSNPSVADLKFSHKLDPIKKRIRPIFKQLPEPAQNVIGKFLLAVHPRKFKEKPIFKEEVRNALAKLLADDVQKMEMLLGKDLSHWLK